MNSRDEVLKKTIAFRPGPGTLRWAETFFTLAVTGLITFVAGISGPHAARVWMAYHVNFLFWSSIAFGSVLFSATLTMTNARWGRPTKRLAEAPGAFLPAAFLLFWVLYPGRDAIFPWIDNPIPEKTGWLNAPFLFARDGLAFLLLTVVSSAILYCSVESDRRWLLRGIPSRMGEQGEPDGIFQAQTVLAPVYGILYGVLLSLIAFDLVMSLSPPWASTLFGAYFFIGAFYMGLAATIVLSAVGVKKLGLSVFIGDRRFHDLGKLLFAFCILTADFFYCQFLIIWCGNLPEETGYLIERIGRAPWNAVAWTVLLASFVVPFILLLSRKLKMKAVPMAGLAGFILAGMWLERFLLVAPSLWRGKVLPLGWIEFAVTAGFFGIMGLCVLAFLTRVPLLPVSDPLFRHSSEATLGIPPSGKDSREEAVAATGKPREAARLGDGEL